MTDDDRVCNVAIEPGADWRSLPHELSITTGARDPEKTSQQRDVRYSRLNGDRHFRTAMTTVAPSSQGSTVIHPKVRSFLMTLRGKYT
jgi:mannose-6-phosphate isomerase-like protein (cupin superfamily)